MIYDHEVRTLQGKSTTLAPYRGKVLLIVNTASECGYTPQLGGLQQLHERLGPRGLVVLGFPCNQFGAQEPGSEEQIAAFCQRNYGVTFPMFAKIDVNGDGAHPLFQELKRSAKGFLRSEAIKWNFTKFLVNREGKVLKRFAPNETPTDIERELEQVL